MANWRIYHVIQCIQFEYQFDFMFEVFYFNRIKVKVISLILTGILLSIETTFNDRKYYLTSLHDTFTCGAVGTCLLAFGLPEGRATNAVG